MTLIEDRARAATRWLALIGFAGLLVLAIMTTLDVLMRWLFDNPIHGVNDVSAVVMAVVIASCIPANLEGRRNISVDVLGAMTGRRATRLLDAFGGFVTLLFIGAVAWQFIGYADSMYHSGRRTWVLALPLWPWWAAATAFLWFAALIQLANVIRDLHRTLTGGSDGHASPHPIRPDAADSLGHTES
ncbi:hypothetical protein BOO69_02780 [Sulfitobacter alexandrii]|uniref:TRAP transporter small permease protein n=1 Tax=Sulfitobacter alexandrii TaxID=1917485 RepID=A0A1J0WLY0_9RHOB|nr:hypothetical protein BOO69_02780 [Sulfitobacter alexandrii]